MLRACVPVCVSRVRNVPYVNDDGVVLPGVSPAVCCCGVTLGVMLASVSSIEMRCVVIV
jgi:hypothetical protein